MASSAFQFHSSPTRYASCIVTSFKFFSSFMSSPLWTPLRSDVMSPKNNLSLRQERLRRSARAWASPPSGLVFLARFGQIVRVHFNCAWYGAYLVGDRRVARFLAGDLRGCEAARGCLRIHAFARPQKPFFQPVRRLGRNVSVEATSRRPRLMAFAFVAFALLCV